MFTFNEHGLLSPAEGIRTTVSELYDVFVADFPASDTRLSLYNEWRKYNQLLRQEIGADFVQWVNGSFVTTKLNPKDIDIVSFIPSRLFRKFEKRLDYYWSDNWEREGIDAYLVEVFTEQDENFNAYQVTLAQWQQLYSRTKPTAEPANVLKGFLIIDVL